MTSLPRQMEVIEFHPKRLSKKFWGLFGEVDHIAQEKFLIDQFATMNSLDCLKCPWQFLDQFALSQYKITTTHSSLHTQSQQLSDFPYESLGFFTKKHKSSHKITSGT